MTANPNTPLPLDPSPIRTDLDTPEGRAFRRDASTMWWALFSRMQGLGGPEARMGFRSHVESLTGESYVEGLRMVCASAVAFNLSVDLCWADLLVSWGDRCDLGHAGCEDHLHSIAYHSADCWCGRTEADCTEE